LAGVAAMGSGFFTSGFFAGVGSDFGFITDLVEGGGTDFFAVKGFDAGFATGTEAFTGAGLAAGFTAFLGTVLGTGFFATGFLAGAGLAGAFFAGLAAFFFNAILVILFL